MIKKCAVGVGVVFALGSCTGDGSESTSWVTLTSPNDLGVTTLRIDRGGDQDMRVFELHGYAGGEEIGFVKVHAGRLMGVALRFPESDGSGTEIIAEVNGHGGTTFSQEKELVMFTGMEREVRMFTTLPEVSSLLEREANVQVINMDQHEVGYGTGSTCPSYYLQTGVTAQQCCYGMIYPGPWKYEMWQGTRFSSYDVVYRFGNHPTMYTCKSYGNGGCGGNSCYWGPWGWARANIYTPSGPYVKIANSYPCEQQDWDSPPSADFGNVNGNNDQNAGCCGNGGGHCGTPGFQDCSACAGGDACQGCWDY